MPSHSPKTRFDKALRATLIPLLHAEGFVGKLPRLRRVIGKHLVHVIELQGSRLAKGATYVNLGVHLDFLDDPGFRKNLETLDEADCAIRQRLQTLAGTGDCFHYGDSEEETALHVTGLVEMMKVEGLAFFDQFKSYPGAFAARVKQAAKTGAAYEGPLAPTATGFTARPYIEIALRLKDDASAAKLIERMREYLAKERDAELAEAITAPYVKRLAALRRAMDPPTGLG